MFPTQTSVSNARFVLYMVGERLPDNLVDCPHCSAKVPSGRFCSECGKPLNKAVDDEPEAVLEAHRAELDKIYEEIEEPHISEHLSYPEFQFSIDGMDSQTMAIIFARAEMKVLDEELDRIIAEISSTRHALDLEHADKDLLISRARDLRHELDEAKSRRAKLRSVEGEIPLKNTLSQLMIQTAKLEKLKSAEKTLDPVVFQEEKKRLQMKIKYLQKDLVSALKTSKQWLKSMDNEIKRLRREISRLDAKLKIGDVSQTAYDSMNRELSKAISIIEGGKRSLEETITLAKKSK